MFKASNVLSLGLRVWVVTGSCCSDIFPVHQARLYYGIAGINARSPGEVASPVDCQGAVRLVSKFQGVYGCVDSVWVGRAGTLR